LHTAPAHDTRLSRFHPTAKEIPMQFRSPLLATSLALAIASLAACSSTQPPAAATAAPAAAVAAAPAPDAAPITQSSAAQAASAAYDFDMDVFHPVVGRNGMVASEQELASRIGLQILKSGGNAVDAAVAMGFALAVALPNAGNIGGGGFMIVYDAKSGKNIALDFREVAPSKATRDMYVGADGKVIDGKSLYTHYAVGVPGTVAGMEHALKKWGSLPLSTVIAPAAKLADKGFPVSETLAKILEQEKKNMGQWPATQAIFWRNGEPLKRGDRLVQ
jgi:gamma-glutamyltranspeptidase/glutathione hydrolase